MGRMLEGAAETTGSGQVHGHLGGQMAIVGGGKDLRSRTTPSTDLANRSLRQQKSAGRMSGCDTPTLHVGDFQVRMLEGDWPYGIG